MIDLDKLRADAEAARRYAEYHGVKTWTEHIFAALALADAALARIAQVAALHTSEGWPLDGGGESKDYCTRCDCRWPCATVRALTEGGPDAAL